MNKCSPRDEHVFALRTNTNKSAERNNKSAERNNKSADRNDKSADRNVATPSANSNRIELLLSGKSLSNVINRMVS
ncbi:MAG: hypothetical protein ACI3YC_09130, partial [Alloprevotella sp.]